jgi:hypothetical protein
MIDGASRTLIVAQTLEEVFVGRHLVPAKGLTDPARIAAVLLT